MLSRVRVKLIKQFLSQPNEMFYVRQLTRANKEEINAVRRELKRMEKTGFVKSEPRGNRLYYYPNKQYDFYPDLISLVTKTSGLGRKIRKNKNKLGKIKFAILSSKFVRHVSRDSSEIDLLVVGTVILPELAAIIRDEELKRGSEINYTVMTQEEFTFRKDRRDPFLLGILSESWVMLIGDDLDVFAKQVKDKENA